MDAISSKYELKYVRSLLLLSYVGHFLLNIPKGPFKKTKAIKALWKGHLPTVTTSSSKVGKCVKVSKQKKSPWCVVVIDIGHFLPTKMAFKKRPSGKKHSFPVRFFCLYAQIRSYRLSRRLWPYLAMPR